MPWMRLASAAIKSVSSLPRAGGVCSFCDADAVVRMGGDSDNTRTLPTSIHVSFGHTVAGQVGIGEVQSKFRRQPTSEACESDTTRRDGTSTSVLIVTRHFSTQQHKAHKMIVEPL